MKVRREVIPFVIGSFVLGILVSMLCVYAGARGLAAGVAGGAVSLFFAVYMIYFFRDPERTPPAGDISLVAGADGLVMRVVEGQEKEFLKTETVRISIFLSLFDVHVNRSPLAGKVKFLGYFPGKRYLTFKEKSSELNQHNSILIEGQRTRCLVNQIVGPVCRRVVYWLEMEQDLKKGDRIGMMKFGSRLDMYFPSNDVKVVAKVGDKVRAGETVVAEVVKGGGK